MYFEFDGREGSCFNLPRVCLIKVENEALVSTRDFRVQSILGNVCIWDPGPTFINNMSKPCFNIDPFNKYGIRNFHPMTSNSFQFVFWIIFVYSLNKPVTNEIQKENWK